MQLGVPGRLQNTIILVVAVLFIVAVIRLFGGLFPHPSADIPNPSYPGHPCACCSASNEMSRRPGPNPKNELGVPTCVSVDVRPWRPPGSPCAPSARRQHCKGTVMPGRTIGHHRSAVSRQVRPRGAAPAVPQCHPSPPYCRKPSGPHPVDRPARAAGTGDPRRPQGSRHHGDDPGGTTRPRIVAERQRGVHRLLARPLPADGWR